MPRKGGKEKETLKGLTEIKKLWKSVAPGEWLALLQEISPEHKWTMHGQNQIKGQCPYHDDSDPSFVLTFSRGMGKCFGACEKVVVDLVSLIAKLRKCSYAESLMFLNSRFNLSLILGEKAANSLTEYNQVQEMKKATVLALKALMEELIRECPSHLRYCLPALYYLTKVRNLPPECLPHLPVGIWAKPEHIRQYIDDAQLHPLFDQYFKDQQSSAYWGCPIFYYNDSPGSISRFKIRLKDQEEISKIPQGFDLTKLPLDTARRMYSKVFTYVNDPYSESMGVYGLFFYRRMIGRNDGNAYITEGEFDVLSVMAGQLMHESLDFMILGTGGKGSLNIGFLTEYGIKTAWVVPDSPLKQGDEYTKGILGNKNNYPVGVGAKSLALKIFSWPHEFRGMDLDEAVNLNGYPCVSDYLYTSRLRFFINSYPWVLAKCEESVNRIRQEYEERLLELDETSETYEVERANLVDDRRNRVKDTVITWYNYVKDPVDRQDFVQRYNTSDNLDLEKIDTIKTAMYSLDTHAGVAKRMYEETQKYFVPVYKKTKPTSEALCLWVKEDRTVVELAGTEKNTYDAIATYTKMPITDWFSTVLGDNEVYLSGLCGKPLEDERIKRRNAKLIMDYVWELFMPGVKNIRDLQYVAQGIHYHSLPPNVRRQGIVYIVNGKYVFKGKYVDSGQLDWELLDSAVDNDILFEGLRDDEQWSSITDVTELYEASAVDLMSVYNKVRRILAQWTFKYDDVIQRYLAAYIMSLPVMAAVGDVNITFIAGDPESGKTSLIYGLLGGKYSNSEAIPHIMEAALASTNATAASVYQEFDAKTLLCVLDEVDQNENRSKAQVDRFLDLRQNMYSIPMGGCYIRRGGVTRDQRETYHLRMPILMAGTTIPADSVFLSRVFVIYTKKTPGKLLDANMPIEDIIKLRREVTIGLLPHIPDLVVLRKKLASSLLKLGEGIATISTRFLECILTPLTVYEFIGAGKAEELYLDIIRCYKDRLDALHGTDTQSDLINMCLYVEQIKVMGSAGLPNYVSARSLILAGEITTLNNSECGVYFIPEKEYIVVVWRQVKYTLLKHSRYSSTDETALYEVAGKTPFAVRDVTEDIHAYVRDYLGLADVKGRTSYSVIHAEYLIRSDVMEKTKENRRLERLSEVSLDTKPELEFMEPSARELFNIPDDNSF